MDKALAYAQDHHDTFLDQLFEFLRIESISTDKNHYDDVRGAASWLANELTRIGMQARVMPTDLHPVVYAEWLGAGDDAPTVLVYGHYDVQPADPIDLWTTPAFQPDLRDGKIYARGAADDKGQVFIHVKAIEALLAAEGGCPVNIKMLIEGEEEIGSPSIEAFVAEHRDMLDADTVLVSDTAFLSRQTPLLVYGLRGLVYMQIDIEGPKHDLHSGHYGGTVYNPAQVLAEMLTKLHHDDATVAIPGFYDNVAPLSEAEREALAQVHYPLEQWQAETGMTKPWGEADYSLIERRGARPTCEINGMWSGFTGEGSKTIIPDSAGAKVSMRLVPNQDPNEIAQLFTDYIHQIAPEHVKVTVRNLNGGWPFATSIDAPPIQAAARALQDVWGVETAFSREGGSIPIVATFDKALGAPSVLMGFSVPGAQIHAPDEHFYVDQFTKGIEAVIRYYYYLASDE